MIYEVQGKRQLIIWHPEALNGLNPETGEVYWSEKFPTQQGLSVATPRLWHGDHLFLTSFYNGSRMYEFKKDSPGVNLVWASKKVSERDTENLHTIMSTPFIADDFIYGICSYGQLRGLKAADGERVWETLAATTADLKPTRWGNAFLIRNGDRFFIPNERGDLIIAKLTPAGYREISRAHLLEPTNPSPGRDVVWSHPAFANGAIYTRNDRELVCADLKIQ